MMRLWLLLLFFVVAGDAQDGADGRIDTFDLRMALPPGASPMIELGTVSVSLARLRHKPNPKAVSAFRKGEKFAGGAEVDKAVMALELAVALDGEFSEAHCNLGVQYQRAGRFREAAVEFGRAVELDATTGVYHSNFAVALAALEEHETALKEAMLAIDLNSTDATAHLIAGWELASSVSTRDSAISHLQFASRAFADAHLLLALIWMAGRDSVAAQKEVNSYWDFGKTRQNRGLNRGDPGLR